MAKLKYGPRRDIIAKMASTDGRSENLLSCGHIYHPTPRDERAYRSWEWCRECRDGKAPDTQPLIDYYKRREDDRLRHYENVAHGYYKKTVEGLAELTEKIEAARRAHEATPGNDYTVYFAMPAPYDIGTKTGGYRMIVNRNVPGNTPTGCIAFNTIYDRKCSCGVPLTPAHLHHKNVLQHPMCCYCAGVDCFDCMQTNNAIQEGKARERDDRRRASEAGGSC